VFQFKKKKNLSVFLSGFSDHVSEAPFYERCFLEVAFWDDWAAQCWKSWYI